ncbi:unnamed protein product [Cyprideis torosa]|uniref:Uncharacterized protein n=1 Tax=Cyprideis torosa TaxID=163714 RepID=A0A7R8ZGG7_9CRUS|nr:unnamed protein product [Cyprideis torosa]CAG0881614.1 unnamed protein product [Cyprideis torosa]
MSSAFVLSDSFGFPTGVIASPTPNETIGAHCGSLCGDWDRLMEAWPIPPPPLPSFFPGDTPPRIAWDPITNESCNFCDWARGEDSVDFIELSHPDPPVDDTLFIVITACCIGGTLLGLLATMLILRYRRAQSKFTIGKVSSKLPTSSSSFTCDGVLYGSTVTPPAVAMTGTTSSRALWAGIRANGTNQYTVDHLQPLEQRQCQPDFNFTTADKKV